MHEALPDPRSETLAKNLSFLALRFPRLRAKLDAEKPDAARGGFSLSLSPSGKPNIRYRGTPFHAPRDPEREARSLVEGIEVRSGRVFVFLGIGMGYHIEAFKKLYGGAEGAALIAVERNLEAFALLIEARDVSFLDGVILFVGDAPERIEAAFGDADPLRFAGYRIIRLRGACAPFPEFYGRLETSFRRTMAGMLSDVLTRFAFEGLWMKNIVLNAGSMAGRRSIRALDDSLGGKTALVLGAGPSLLDRPDALTEIASRVCTIAVDTALDALLALGIVPDYVVTLDGQFHNLHDFTGVFTGRGGTASIRLVADLACYPGIPKRWEGDVYVSASAFQRAGNGGYELHPLVEKLREMDDAVDALPCGGSVATTALELAVRMGAGRIFVSGLDLGYTRFLTHAVSSAPYRARLLASTRFDTLLTSTTRSIGARPLRRAPGTAGGRILTDFVFLSYMRWIAERPEFGGKIVSIDESGLEIPGVQRASAEEAAGSAGEGGGKEIRDRGPSQERVAPRRPGEHVLKKPAALRFLDSLGEETARALVELKGRKWKGCGEDFVRRYPFLAPIIAEAEALYREPEAVGAGLRSFLPAFERWVSRAREKASRGPGR